MRWNSAQCVQWLCMRIYNYLVGEKGVKTIVATNSNARMLLGKTMPAAGNIVFRQSLTASSLKPNSRQRKTSETEWQDAWLLIIDEKGAYDRNEMIHAHANKDGHHAVQRVIREDVVMITA